MALKFKTLCEVTLCDYFNFWLLWLKSNFFFSNIYSHLSAHSLWPKFSYDCLWTMHSHLSKLLPNGETGSYFRVQRIYPSMTERENSPKQYVLHRPPSCALHCGLIQTTISSLQVRFQTCHLIFPWHGATGTILVSSRVLGTNNTTLLTSFSKVNLGLGPSETLTPLRGENLNVHERHVRVLSVVNNKQNRHIPAAYKHAWPCWMSEVLPWRLYLYGSSWLFLCVTSCH